MKPFIISPHAAYDLNGIWLYLAEEASEEIADRALQKLASSFADLAQSPGIGRRRRDLTKLPVHFLFVEPYMVVYQRDRATPHLAVLHGARDLRRILRTSRSAPPPPQLPPTSTPHPIHPPKDVVFTK